MEHVMDVVMVSLVLAGLGVVTAGAAETLKPGSFGDDMAFLKKHTDVFVLRNEAGNARVAVVPQYQGRVMTSTAGGDAGDSFGWINRGPIASGELQPHINVFGGEDRFWMGPEGGQYAIFFPEGAKFDFEVWQTPAVIDSEPYDTVRKSDTSATFQKEATLTNWSGTELNVGIERTIRLVNEVPDVDVPEAIQWVAYESENTLRNTGDAPWKKDTGLLSIWILGMYKPAEEMTIVLPFKPGPEEELGPEVNDAYFGKVPADRLIVKDDVLFFKGDGKQRGKIGIAPQRAKPVAGSYDAAGKVLTIVTYTLPEGATDYVNSMWELQDAPYAGDVVNSYNDGPPEPGKPPLGPFYELETSSPAAPLEPGSSITHVHRTYHFQGPEDALDALAVHFLGVNLATIKAAF